MVVSLRKLTKAALADFEEKPRHIWATQHASQVHNHTRTLSVANILHRAFVSHNNLHNVRWLVFSCWCMSPTRGSSLSMKCCAESRLLCTCLVFTYECSVNEPVHVSQSDHAYVDTSVSHNVFIMPGCV